MSRVSSLALLLLVACGPGTPVKGAPVITKQPASASFAAGSTATFNVVASGTGTLIYQWSRGGAAIAGATAATLSLPSVASTDDKAILSVVVKNAAGSVKSADAILTVTTPAVTDTPYPTLCTGPMSTGFCWVTAISGTQVTFADARNGILANGPLLFRTTDAGIHWFLATVNGGPDLASIERVRFLGPTLAVAVGQTRLSGAVTLRSTDGGATWSPVASGIPGALLGVGFSGAKIGAQVGAGGVIAHTTDGGATWLSASVPAFPGLLNAVAFGSDTVAVAVGTVGNILRTTDSGVTWSIVGSGGENYETVTFATATTAFIAGDVMKRSDDAGLTWATVVGVSGIEDIAFSDPMHGIATGPNGKSVQTDNGGATWTSLTGAQSSLHAVAFADASTVVVLGQAIQRSIDAGKTWSVTSPAVEVSQPSLNGIRYADSQVAVAVGGNDGFGPLIRRTLDSGGTWTDVTSPTADALVAVDFATPTVGAAVGGGVVLRTSDAGATWTVASSDPSRKLYAVRFADAKVGIAVGRQGLILRTVDAGATWAPLTTGSFGSNALTAVSFGSALVGVMGDDSGSLFRTTDAGLTWQQTVTGTPGTGSTGIGFAGENTVVAVGSGGIIRRSTDAGATWTVLVPADASAPNLRGIRFVTSMLGYIVGESGVIRKTTDGGATWTEPFPRLPSPFTCVDFSGMSNGLIGGAFANILRTTTAGE